MFHIKEDKRSQKSAELIINSMKECLKKKTFENITITDIQKNAAIGRATFYRLFDRTEDVLEYSCDMAIKRFLGELHSKEYVTTRDLTEQGLKIADFLELIITSRREYILYTCVSKYEKEIRAIMKMDKKDECNKYCATILTGAIISVLCEWIRSGRKESAEELDKEVSEAFRQLFDSYNICSAL
ncbi:MAG: hypothetical protein NC394_00875 [Bacteroides sp.]|nr:hypothetical protein [Bacteroides sp.]